MYKFNPTTDSSDSVIDHLMDEARAIEGRRRCRTLRRSDAADLITLIESHPDAHMVRSYSRDGFVANCYFGNAVISRATAVRQDDGTWGVYVDVGSAKRSYGKRALLTVDNRGV